MLLKPVAQIGTVLVVGLPLRVDSKLFNCAVVIHRGRMLGIMPKSFLPNYREFYEKRQFASALDAPAGRSCCWGSDGAVWKRI